MAARMTMQRPVATEAQEGQLFFVEERIAPPALIGQHLSSGVGYRWRDRVAQEWTYGSVRERYTLVTGEVAHFVPTGT